MNFAYFAAFSVTILAQAAAAQNLPLERHAKQRMTTIDEAVTLKFVSPRGQFVVLTDDRAWIYDSNPTVIWKGATVAGVKVDPSKLKAGMSCVLTGYQFGRANVISTLACK